MADKNNVPWAYTCIFRFVYGNAGIVIFSLFPSGEAGREIYLERLKEEIKARGAIYQDYNIETLFIGGGTPSLMTGQQLTELLDTVRASFHVSPSR